MILDPSSPYYPLYIKVLAKVKDNLKGVMDDDDALYEIIIITMEKIDKYSATIDELDSSTKSLLAKEIISKVLSDISEDNSIIKKKSSRNMLSVVDSKGDLIFKLIVAASKGLVKLIHTQVEQDNLDCCCLG